MSSRRRSKSKISGIHRLTTGRKMQLLLVFLLAQSMFAWSDSFRLRHITVLGAERLRDGELVRATGLRLQSHPHVSEFSLAAVRDRLRDVLWVENATVNYRFPSELVVRVKERHPVALAAQDDGRPNLASGGWQGLPWYLVDSEGLVLERVETTTGPALPRLLVSRPLRIHKKIGTMAIDKVLAWTPVLRQTCGNRIEYFEVDAMGQVSFVTPLVGKPTLVRIGSPEKEFKVQVLSLLCRRIEREHRPVDYIDLRFAYPAIRYPNPVALAGPSVTASSTPTTALSRPAPKSTPTAVAPQR